MPLYLGTIRKRISGQNRTWVNTYHVNAASEEDAMTILIGVYDVERAVHWSVIAFDRLTIRLASGLATSGIQQAVTGNGERDSAGEDFLPQFCTVRVIFTDGINRPDQKYLRLPIAEGEQEFGALETSLINFIGTNYSTPLVGSPGVVSSNGAPYTGATVYLNVQNRQVGWHRRTRPGFKRGWVPV